MVPPTARESFPAENKDDRQRRHDIHTTHDVNITFGNHLRRKLDFRYCPYIGYIGWLVCVQDISKKL